MKPRTLFTVTVFSLLSFVEPLILYLKTYRLVVTMAALGVEILVGAFLLVFWSWVGIPSSAFNRSLFGRTKSANRGMKSV